MAKATKQDATIRNVRASQRRDDALAARVAALEVEVEQLTGRVDALENEVTELSEDAGRAFVPFGEGDEGEDDRG
jgi:uncharacterized protein YceH (UPF0502 family)